MLIRKPKALHICCHGITNNASTFTTDHSLYKEEGDFLLFETICGGGELVSSKRLKKLIRAQCVHFDLVFLAVCNSESIGEIFQESGAKHVICIKKGKKVLDEAALTFTKTFYELIFTGQSFCDAFNKAKGAVEFLHNEGEAGMFFMLLQEDLKVRKSYGVDKADIHICNQFGPFSEGLIKDLTDKVEYKYFPSKIANLKGR